MLTEEMPLKKRIVAASIVDATLELAQVGALAGQTSRFGAGRFIRLWRFPVNFLLKSFTWDALLLMVPGIMGLATSVRMKMDKNSPFYLTIGSYSMSKFPLYSATFLLICACMAIFIGVFRFSAIGLHTKTSVNYYIVTIAMLTLANFSLGVSSVMAGSRIRNSLERNTLRQIRNMHENDSPLQFKSSLEEAWDILQIQFSCCGANGYEDYSKSAVGQGKSDPLPDSCCSIRWNDEIPKINNRAQCQLDAKLGVKGSIYINMPGCLDPLMKWTKHYIYAQVFVMFLSAFSQCIALVYSYVIYYRPMQRYELQR